MSQVILAQGVNGLLHFHRPGEASNYTSPFDRALLSVAEGLRASGSLRRSTALFRFMFFMVDKFFLIPTSSVRECMPKMKDDNG
ncbi:MAG: hypothetical protein CVV06_19365 [Gammaproteobacteria bacterium HGW-Gammaproteobacteria-10]|nr:MAG: hypothetical protein CVV06_19365 [Gammaproteobacteria bacterium HGW-Gammaproteobacteria-10]